MKPILPFLALLLLFCACKKDEQTTPAATDPNFFSFSLRDSSYSFTPVTFGNKPFSYDYAYTVTQRSGTDALLYLWVYKPYEQEGDTISDANFRSLSGKTLRFDDTDRTHLRPDLNLLFFQGEDWYSEGTNNGYIKFDDVHYLRRDSVSKLLVYDIYQAKGTCSVYLYADSMHQGMLTNGAFNLELIRKLPR